MARVNKRISNHHDSHDGINIGTIIFEGEVREVRIIKDENGKIAEVFVPKIRKDY